MKSYWNEARDIIMLLVTIISLYSLLNRIKNQDKQIELQINQRVDGRFNAAINLLGSKETSARTGAIYALHELAIEENKYRKQITQILCSHIRSKTNEKNEKGENIYQTQYKDQPSNEIQTAFNLLFNKDKGLYTKTFSKNSNFPKIDLSKAFLYGVDLSQIDEELAHDIYQNFSKSNLILGKTTSHYLFTEFILNK